MGHRSQRLISKVFAARYQIVVLILPSKSESTLSRALRSMYIQTVLTGVSSVCCALGIAKLPKIMAWPFPSPVESICLSTASVKCVKLTINSASL